VNYATSNLVDLYFYSTWNKEATVRHWLDGEGP
jgi:hypothetical protein